MNARGRTAHQTRRWWTSGAARALAVTAVGASLAACNAGVATTGLANAGPAVRGGILNMLGSGDVDYMDPNISYYSTGYTGLRLWSRQLYTFPATPGHTTDTVPDLADGPPVTSADGKTVTVHMRSGVMWNTTPAREVTAADVVRGVKRTCNPAQPFGGLPDYEDLLVGFTDFCAQFAKVPQNAGAIGAFLESHDFTGVRATDTHTVVFSLTHPAAYFRDMLVLPALSPAPKEFDAYLPGSADLAQHTISDGPYYVASYNPGKSIDFKRNSAWDAGTDPVRKAYVDEVRVTETEEQDSIQQQLQVGDPHADLEWDVAPPPAVVPGLIARHDPDLNLGETSSITPYVIFNELSPNNGGALKQVAVRQALSLALDRQHIIQTLGGPVTNPPLTHALPADIVGGETNFDLYPHDVAKARSLLAAAGYPHGLTLKFIYRGASDSGRKTFETVQQDLKAVGIKVQGVAVPTADFYTKYMEVPDVARRGVWDVSLSSWGADWFGNAALSYFAPLWSSSAFPPAGSNFGYHHDPVLDQLVERAAAATSLDEARQLWHQADEQVMKEAAIFPVTNPRWPSYHASQVHNAVFVPAFQNFDPANVWLSADKQAG